jgi:hypothetical protein
MKRLLPVAAGAFAACLLVLQIMSCSDEIHPNAPEPPGVVQVTVLQPGDDGTAAAEGDGEVRPRRVDPADTVEVFVVEGLGTVIASLVLPFSNGSFSGTLTVPAGNHRVVTVEVTAAGASQPYEFGIDTDVNVTAGKTTSATVVLGSTIPGGISASGGSSAGDVDVSWSALSIAGLDAGDTRYTVFEFKDGGPSPASMNTVTGATSLSLPGRSSGSYRYRVQASNPYAGSRSITGPRSSLSTPAVNVSNDLPSLSEVDPDTGRVGDVVTITGSHLNTGPTDPGKPDVYFAGGVKAGVAVVSQSEIQVTVPLGAQTGDITVTNNAGSQTIAFSMLPTVLDFAPRYGVSGAPITIYGYNLTGISVPTVQVGGASWSIQGSPEPTKIVALVSSSSCSAPIEVVVDGHSDVSDSTFTVLDVPIIAGVVPDSAIGGSTTVSVFGTDLVAPGLAVTVGGAPASAAVVTDDSCGGTDQIDVDVPGGGSGSALEVSHVGGTDSFVGTFEVLPAPVVSGFLPDSVTAGTDTLSVLGVFRSGAQDLYEVFFTTAGQDSIAVPVSATATRLEVAVPDMIQDGTITVRLTVNRGTGGEDSAESTSADMLYVK